MQPFRPTSPSQGVRHYLPGGREAGGGIGRLAGYILDAVGPEQDHAIRDTRGPRWDPLYSGLRLLAAMMALLRDRVMLPERVHHIHVAGRGSTRRKLLLCALARRIGARHLLHLHDYDYQSDYDLRSPRQQRAVRRMFSGADRVLVLGQRDRITVTDTLGVPEARVIVVPNCVPDPHPGSRAVPRQMRPDAPVGIVFLGQLGPRKGVPELLTALAHPALADVAPGAPRWRAVLAGDGPVATYRAEVADLGLSDRVQLPGWLSEAETHRICAAAEILVLPSHGEGMAMAVLEGLAQGLAVVTTPVGAHPEVLDHGRTCLFVPPGDAEALALALARLVTDHEERARLGAAGRALYLDHLGIESYLRRLLPLYQFDTHQNIATVGAA